MEENKKMKDEAEDLDSDSVDRAYQPGFTCCKNHSTIRPCSKAIEVTL